MRILMMWFAASLPLLAAGQDLQGPSDVQRWFEAGKYLEVVKAAEGQEGTPANWCLAGQSDQKLN